MRRHTLLAIVLIVVVAFPLLPQGSGTDKPSFEVASIKPNNSGDNRVMFRFNGGRFTVAGATAKMLIQQAYRVRDFQLSGGPGWIGSDRFDIEAKPENVADMTPERMPLMLQGLLVERFQLKTHKETKELPIYELVVAKDGSKLKSVPEPPRPAPGTPPGPPPAPGGPMPPGAFRIGRGEMMGSAIPIRKLYPIPVINAGPHGRQQNRSHRIFRCPDALGSGFWGNRTIRSRAGRTTSGTCRSRGPIDIHCIAGTTRPATRVLQGAGRSSRHRQCREAFGNYWRAVNGHPFHHIFRPWGANPSGRRVAVS